MYASTDLQLVWRKNTARYYGMTIMEKDKDVIMAHAATGNDGSIPEMANRHKQEANRLVASKDYDGASHRYLAALRCVPSPPLWPRHEEFVLTLHSNLALCFLKLHRAQLALEHTTSARALPIFAGKTTEPLRQKILARHVEALLMIKERGVEGHHPASVSDTLLWSTLEEAQQRGYLTKGSWELRRNFLRYGGRMIAAPDRDEDAATTTKRALQAWTDHLVRSGTCTAIQAMQARRQYEQQTTRPNDASCTFTEKQVATSALQAIQSILPAPELPMGDVCKYLMTSIRKGDTDMGVQILRNMLKREKGLYSSQVDDDETGYLMWAVCFGLLTSNDKGEGPTCTFCTVLKVLVEEYGVHVDQRAQTADSRNPLQYVTQSGRPEAVRAMLRHGANVNLRDGEGWTALHSVCMDSVEDHGGGPSTEDRVETARLLIEAGADLEATSYLGMTPLLTLCTKPVVPLFELLLSKGANLEHRTENGWSAIFLLDRADLDQGTRTKCTNLLNRGGKFDTDMKMLKFTKLMDDVLVPVNNSCKSRLNPLQQLFRSPEGTKERAEQERVNLQALLKYVDMNPDLLTKPFQKIDTGNWLAEFHKRVNDLIPEAFQKVYRQELPNNEELGLMMANNRRVLESAETEDSSTRRFDKEAAVKLLFGHFRDRGNHLTKGHMDSYFQTVVDPIQHCVGFAVPSDAILDRISSYGPVIEVGAGTGYWSAALQSKGVDSLAFDLTPPDADHGNYFFDTAFTHVEQGDATTPGFWKKSGRSGRTLLIVWPNNPDEIDNPHLYKGEEIPPVWDADCLYEYLKAGGKTVVFVGEREENIQVLPGCPPDCGVSAGRRFQTMLKEKFDMAECHKIPTWFLSEDDATIWVRKTQ